MLGSSGWDKEIAAIARLADRRFLLPAIRIIIPRTPVIGRRINIHWLSDGRPANNDGVPQSIARKCGQRESERGDTSDDE